MDYSTLPINQPVPELARHHYIWAKTRAFVEGEEAVKAQGEALLPRVRTDDSQAQYQRHLDNTNFYPAVTKIAQGIVGLIMRKPAQLNTTSARVQQLASTSLTASGMTHNEFAEEIVRETLITNYTGVLADHPSASQFTNLNAANADRLGFRPRLGMYVGESILEATVGPVGQDRGYTRVRLLEEHGRRVRELTLNKEGFYEQRVHNVDAGGQFSAPPLLTMPLINGQPLTQIPFQIVSTSDKPWPQPSLLKASVDLNLQHYRLSGVLANMTWMTSGPIVTVIGFDRATTRDDAGNTVVVDPQWDFSPNAIVEIANKDAKLDYFIFDPKGAELAQDQLDNIKTDLSTIGHSILAPEKAAPEAAETTMLRRSAENATLAGFTRAISGKLEKSLRLFAQWVDPANSDLSYALNTDFTPRGLTAQDMTALIAAWQAGAFTHDQLLHSFVDGGVLSAALDIEGEVERAKAETADRPPVAP